MAHRLTTKIMILAAAIVATFGAAIADRPALAGPSCGDSTAAASSAAASGNVARKFAQLYRAWHRQSDAIQFSSNTGDYIALPAYRGIVGLGRPALPLLAKILARDRGGDFMLAHAVVEICGWDAQAFADTSHSEQAFRDKVLRKLNSAE